MANQAGKRYACGICKSEMLVTRGGDGVLECCDQPMTIKGSPASAQSAAPEGTPRG